MPSVQVSTYISVVNGKNKMPKIGHKKTPKGSSEQDRSFQPDQQHTQAWEQAREYAE